jgi:formate hydrogenlyase subunit 4
LRLLRKEVVLAENASWLFRVTPYITFAAIWVAAALVPTFATGCCSTDRIDRIVALLGSARFFSRRHGRRYRFGGTAPAAKS